MNIIAMNLGLMPIPDILSRRKPLPKYAKETTSPAKERQDNDLFPTVACGTIKKDMTELRRARKVKSYRIGSTVYYTRNVDAD